MTLRLAFLTLAEPSVPRSSTDSPAPVVAENNVKELNTDGFDYITTADDGTSYFGKLVKRVSDTALLDLVIVDDPDNNKETYKWRQAYNCADNTYQTSDMKWISIPPKTSSVDLIKYACL